MFERSSSPRHRIEWVIALTLALSSVSCAVDPVSGLPEPVGMSEEAELQQGEEVAKIVEEQIGLVDDPRLNAYVDKVGRRLLEHSQRKNIQHQFKIVELAEPNAFALPGGYIYVSRGLLALLNSEDELATVLAHEMGHVAARHSVDRQTANIPLIPVKIAAGLGGMAASIISPTLGAVVAGIGTLPGELALATYSRSQEREADRLGQEYAAAAGWDPGALSTCMHSLTREARLQGGDPSKTSFFSSHPTSPEREKATLEFGRTLTRAPTPPIARDQADFYGRLVGLVVGPTADEGVFVDNRFMQPEMNFAIDFPKGWETVNTPSMVAAQNEDGSALVVLELASEKGNDPGIMVATLEGRVSYVSAPAETRINGLPAIEAIANGGTRTHPSRVHLLWVAIDGLIYQITGAAKASRWDSLDSTLKKSVVSIRPLGARELADVREDRLRLVEAKQGETLAQVVERSESEWTPEVAAVMNGRETTTPLRAGESIKISRSEPYRR